LEWRFSDEAFMQPFSSWLSNGKFRIGYGETGNSNIGNRIQDTYGAGYGAAFGESFYTGILASQLGNPKLRKISYVRCRNITLGYVLPLPKNIANQARIYADLNNPFILTNWTGLDPETDLSFSTPYPNIMSISFGVDITF
jgi:hypothetical protein